MPRSNRSFSCLIRSIMCSTTSWFLPRRPRSSASCSWMPALRASRIERTVAASVRISVRVAVPTMSRFAGINSSESACSSCGRRLFASRASSPFTLASSAFCAETAKTWAGGIASVCAEFFTLREHIAAVVVEPVFACQSDRDTLGLGHLREHLAHLVGRGKVERQSDPLVGVILEFGHRAVFRTRFDRQQANRRGPRRVVQELGGAHGRAPGGRGQETLAEVGEKYGVDQFRLAARELGDKRDDQLVLVQALEQMLDLEVGLGIGKLLLREPLMQAGYSGGQPAPPVAVGFEACGKLSGLDHLYRLPRSRVHPVRSDCSINRAKTKD